MSELENSSQKSAQEALSQPTEYYAGRQSLQAQSNPLPARQHSLAYKIVFWSIVLGLGLGVFLVVTTAGSHDPGDGLGTAFGWLLVIINTPLLVLVVLSGKR